MGLFKYLKEKFSGQANKEKYISGLHKSHEQLQGKLLALTEEFPNICSDYFEALEEILIESDISVTLATSIIENTRITAKKQKISATSLVNEILIDQMFSFYSSKGAEVDSEIVFKDEGPTVLLVVGVNGVGKTTTIAKLAKHYKDMGKSVMLVAADTFRAGATEQLQVWAQRLSIEIAIGAPESDPSSVIYQGLEIAKKKNIDLVICDTAGRLQNKVKLMDELAKMRRVMSKIIEDAPHETFLVIDATTGQNGVAQAKAFQEVTSLSGVVITKMDGTSKGGIILSIREQLGIPVRFIGLGEQMDDLEPFDLDKYLYGLVVGNN